MLTFLLGLGIAAALLTLISRIWYHRSAMATLAELFIRFGWRKKRVYASEQRSAACMEAQDARNGAAYKLPFYMHFRSKVDMLQCGGVQVLLFHGGAEDAPTVAYLHGGAYVNRPTPFHLRFCRRLAAAAAANVVMPLYPLAPAHTCTEAYAFLSGFYRVLKEQAKGPIVLMGDSAGGGLAAGFCEYLGQCGLEQPDKLILLSPWVDVTMANPDMAAYEAADPMLAKRGAALMGAAWAGELDVRDYRVSPLYGDVRPLKNVTTFVGTREILYPDVMGFHEKLLGAGVNASLIQGEGMNHVYPIYPIPEARQALGQIVEAVKQ